MDAPSEQKKKTLIELDDKDLQILKLVQENAKLTVRDIAEKVNLSATPTHERLKRLAKHGVIRQYAAILDSRMLKKSIMVICNISLKDHDKKTAQGLIESIKKFPEVLECYNISAEFDFMLKIV